MLDMALASFPIMETQPWMVLEGIWIASKGSSRHIGNRIGCVLNCSLIDTIRNKCMKCFDEKKGGEKGCLKEEKDFEMMEIDLMLLLIV